MSQKGVPPEKVDFSFLFLGLSNLCPFWNLKNPNSFGNSGGIFVQHMDFWAFMQKCKCFDSLGKAVSDQFLWLSGASLGSSKSSVLLVLSISSVPPLVSSAPSSVPWALYIVIPGRHLGLGHHHQISRSVLPHCFRQKCPENCKKNLVGFSKLYNVHGPLMEEKKT